MSLSPNQSKEVDEVLSALGIQPTDQSVYLTLLRMGQTTLTPLSKSLPLPVSTIQSSLKRLADKGLISYSKNRTRGVYAPKDPRVLKDIVEGQLHDVSTILPFLKDISGEHQKKTYVEVYNRQRFSDVFLKAITCESRIIYEIVAARDFQEILGEKFHFTSRRVKLGVHLRSLRVELEEIKKYSKDTHQRELREAKFLPHGTHFKGSILCWDDCIFVMSSKDERIGVLIKSASIGLMYRQIFDILWDVSRKVDTAS